MRATPPRAAFAALVIVSILLGVSAASFGQVVAPTSGLRVHEWGVWKVEHGQITIDDLARESPNFVLRAPQPTAAPLPVLPSGPVPPAVPSPPPPHPPYFPPGVRKPVIFLYTSRPVHVQVHVDFPGGRPWLYYPHAAVTAGGPRGGSVQWEGTVAPGHVSFALVDPGHWWNVLRRVDATPFLPSTTNAAEQFLFYDGIVPFSSAFSMDAGAAVPVARSSESRVWLVAQGRFTAFEQQPGAAAMTQTSTGAVAQLRSILEREALTRGLSSAETRALLDVWSDDLFTAAAPHLVYFLPRATYDRMLPLTVTPRPESMARVGLIIEER